MELLYDARELHQAKRNPLKLYARAIEALSKTIRVDPGVAVAHLNRAAAFFECAHWRAGHGGNPKRDLERATRDMRTVLRLGQGLRKDARLLLRGVQRVGRSTLTGKAKRHGRVLRT